MTESGNTKLSLEVKGTTAQKLLVAILLLFPCLVFVITPIYNFKTPTLFGLTFFYWFQTLWLFVSSMFFLAAAFLLNKMEGDE